MEVPVNITVGPMVSHIHLSAFEAILTTTDFELETKAKKDEQTKLADLAHSLLQEAPSPTMVDASEPTALRVVQDIQSDRVVPDGVERQIKKATKSLEIAPQSKEPVDLGKEPSKPTSISCATRTCSLRIIGNH
jgi:hypothetical protein